MTNPSAASPTSRRRWPWVLAALALIGAAALALKPPGGPRGPLGAERYLSQAVERADIARVVTISGAISPVNLVQVGTQISGTLKRLHVDYNSPVKAGQLLAEIDPATLDADLAVARAQLLSAQASLALARSKLQRSREQFEQGFISRAAQDDAEAAVAVAEAAAAQARAGASRAGTLRAYAEIRSPVAGVVVSREISVGQTVAASLQTPTLFRIAQDLREMQIEAQVAEADVGLLQEGQPVSFGVDAFAERRFEGRLRQIRNNHQVQQNVVTYTAVIAARNDDLSLRPGMTAYVAVTVAERKAVLRVPAAALRYEPSGAERAAGGVRRVWRLDAQGQPQALALKLGVSDSRGAELLDAQALHEGERLLIGERVAGGFAGPKIF